MKKQKKVDPIPDFKNEDEERDFWANHSALDYPERFKPVKLNFPNLKFSTRNITIRVTDSLLNDLKTAANRKDVPYQSLIKIYLHEIVKRELGR